MIKLTIKEGNTPRAIRINPAHIVAVEQPSDKKGAIIICTRTQYLVAQSFDQVMTEIDHYEPK